MRSILVMITVMTTQAQAGLWQKICDKIIMDDVYHWEGTSDAYLASSVKKLEVKAQWKALNDFEQRILGELKAEQEKRARLEAYCKRR